MNFASMVSSSACTWHIGYTVPNQYLWIMWLQKWMHDSQTGSMHCNQV
jgi:hypothetical protein